MTEDWEAQQRKVLEAWQTAIEKSPPVAFARQWLKQAGNPAAQTAVPDPIDDAAHAFGDFSRWTESFATPSGIDKAALEGAVLDLRRRLQAFELAWKKTPYWPLVAPDSLLTMLLGGASSSAAGPNETGGAFLPPLAVAPEQWTAFLPQVGPAREWSKRVQALGEAQSNYAKAVEVLGRIHFQLAHQALGQFAERMQQRTGSQPVEARALYGEFVDTIEHGFRETARGDHYSSAFGEVINAASGFKAGWARWMDEVLAAWNMPTQREVSEIAERVTAVDERLDALEGRLASEVDLRGIRNHLDALTDQLNQLEDDVGTQPVAAASTAKAPAPASADKADTSPEKKAVKKKRSARARRKKRAAKKASAATTDEFSVADIGAPGPPSSE